MISYILILIVSTGNGITSQNIGFADFKSCNEAQDKIEALYKGNYAYGVRVTCVKQ